MTLPTQAELASLAREAAIRCGVSPHLLAGPRAGTSPVNGEPVAGVTWATAADVDAAATRAAAAFRTWRLTPAPLRGGLVRRLGELLEQHKDDLATLVSVVNYSGELPLAQGVEFTV